MGILLRKKEGLTLIELLIALAIAAILLGAVYKMFILQQKTYTVEEQVVDMQQNVRAGINRMMREIRMAGFGIGTGNPNIVNPSPITNSPILNILSACETGPTLSAIDPNNPQITVNKLTDNQGNTIFDTGDMNYISIGGVESHIITGISGTAPAILTLDAGLIYNYPVDGSTPVFGIRKISYYVGTVNGIPNTLIRDDNVGADPQAGPQAGPQPLADNIENLTFNYLDVNGNPTSNFSGVVQVQLTAKTRLPDPDFKGGAGNGYRIRQITADIHVENWSL